VLFHSVTEVALGPVTLAWPDWHSADIAALALSLAAGLALLRWRINLVEVLLATGALGYLAHAIVS
jgi:hypothetical protein